MEECEENCSLYLHMTKLVRVIEEDFLRASDTHSHTHYSMIYTMTVTFTAMLQLIPYPFPMEWGGGGGVEKWCIEIWWWHSLNWCKMEYVTKYNLRWKESETRMYYNISYELHANHCDMTDQFEKFSCFIVIDFPFVGDAWWWWYGCGLWMWCKSGQSISQQIAQMPVAEAAQTVYQFSLFHFDRVFAFDVCVLPSSSNNNPKCHSMPTANIE